MAQGPSLTILLPRLHFSPKTPPISVLLEVSLHQDILDTDLHRGTVWQFLENEFIPNSPQTSPLYRYKYHTPARQLFLKPISLTLQSWSHLIPCHKGSQRTETFIMRRGGGRLGSPGFLTRHLSSPTHLATVLNSVAHVFCTTYTSRNKMWGCWGWSEVQEESGERAQEGGW